MWFSSLGPLECISIVAVRLWKGLFLDKSCKRKQPHQIFLLLNLKPKDLMVF